MRNMFFIEILLVIAGIVFIPFALWANGGASKQFAPVALVVVAVMVAVSMAGANKKALKAVFSVNARYTHALEATAISIAYEKGESRPYIQVYSRGKHAFLSPDMLRSVGLKMDRKDEMRCILLCVKDPETPEWVIHFRDRAEAKQWEERIMQFGETGGRA